MKQQPTIADKLVSHLERSDIRTRHGVRIEQVDDVTVQAEVTIHRVGETEEVMYEYYASPEQFIQALEIHTLRDIYAVDRKQLERLYLDGRGAMICMVEHKYTWFMRFTIEEGKLIAQNDYRVRHEVTENFKTVQDMISYTRNYYTLGEPCEN